MFVSAGVEFVEVIVLVVVAGWVAVAVDSTVFVAAGVGPVAPLSRCPVACPFLTGVLPSGEGLRLKNGCC